MSTYITLGKIQVQHANCIAGLTYGFPAITHFMGYIHALSRKLQKSHNLTLEGCAVVCHQHQIHAYQPKGFGEYIFSQTRNPLTRTGEVAPIMEEGKMHLTVSLVTECKGIIVGGDEGINALANTLKQLSLTQKLAGGIISSLQSVHIDSYSSEEQERIFNRRLSRRLLPGFALIDQSSYVHEYKKSNQNKNSEMSLFDAWLDFVSVKFTAEPTLEKDEKLSEKTKASWKYVTKPNPGYLVPIMTGYKALSPIHEAGGMPNTRDSTVPFCFVEAAYGLGEWKSPHRLKNISDALWHYEQKEGWYLCVNKVLDNPTEDNESFDLPY